MLPSNRELLRHIPDEINFIFRYTKHKTKDDVMDDEVLQRAIMRSLEIIGEATKKLDDGFKAGYSQIEWKKWPQQETS